MIPTGATLGVLPASPQAPRSGIAVDRKPNTPECPEEAEHEPD